MAFTVTDFHDFVRLFWENPRWRTELRRLVLVDVRLELPDLARRIAEWREADVRAWVRRIKDTRRRGGRPPARCRVPSWCMLLGFAWFVALLR